MMRLNKYLASCGIASRRGCDELIKQGKISVNGKKVVDLATQVNDDDAVFYNGQLVQPGQKNIYIMLHKPKGYVTTMSDDLGRKTVADLIDTKERVFPIGRLDYESEGLLLFTNDGELANKLTHPKHEIGKTYVCRISGKIKPQDVKAIRNGVVLEDGHKTKPALAKVVAGNEHTTRIELTIFEGKNREIRRIFATLGYEVEFLKRVAIGQLRLGRLERGKTRSLTIPEINYLKTL